MSRVDHLPTRLNLGCGRDRRSHEWHDVDVSAAVEPDEVVDLEEFPWPWPSNQFERVDANHVFEHLSNPLQAMEEVARILHPGGELHFTYPIGHTRFEDPTHRQFWNWHTAMAIDGRRQHDHEIDLQLALVDRDISWSIGSPEPLVRWYVWWRSLVSGDGPWLEQVPGVYGEITATFRRVPEGRE